MPGARGFGAGGFFAAACAEAGPWVELGAVDAVGRGDSNDEVAFVAGDAGRAAEGVVAVPVPGSGVMMLTGGVEAALGNSALVGLPVGIDGPSAAIEPGVTGGAFQDGA